jgi:hypothetical protein
VECGASSTTSAGAWHLGLLPAADGGPAASAWLSEYLNRDDLPGGKAGEAAIHQVTPHSNVYARSSAV